MLVVGDAMLDRYWFGAVDRISPEAPVPVVRVDREEERLGGAANVASNVKALGAQATLITVVGDDEHGHRARRPCSRREGIDALFRRDPRLHDHRQAARHRPLAAAAARRLRGASPTTRCSPAMLAVSRTRCRLDAVLFSDYGKGGLDPHPAHDRAWRARPGEPVLVDPKGSDYEPLRGRDRDHAEPRRAGPGDRRLVRARHSCRARAGAARALGIDALLLTRSEDGMSLFDAAGHLHVPAQAREVFDVTGAGDTVIATLAAMLGLRR